MGALQCIGFIWLVSLKSTKKRTSAHFKTNKGPEPRSGLHCITTIEIIDIECALLSFLSKKIVSTKWRRCKGILARPNLLWQGISRGCGEWDCFFQTKFYKKRFKLKKKLFIYYFYGHHSRRTFNSRRTGV